MLRAEPSGKGKGGGTRSGKGRGENRGAGRGGRARLPDACETPGEPGGGRGGGAGAGGQGGGGAGRTAGRGPSAGRRLPGGRGRAGALRVDFRGTHERRSRRRCHFSPFRLGQPRGPGRRCLHLPPGNLPPREGTSPVPGPQWGRRRLRTRSGDADSPQPDRGDAGNRRA